MDKKGSRKPEFLSVVEKFQEEDRSIETRTMLPSVTVATGSASPARLY
jgi:hypothetical protein